jgi:hypothetical protein
MEHRLKRALSTPFIILAAFLIWFWEWLWEPLQNFMAWIGRLPILRSVEATVARLPRYLALACFVVPGLVLLPFKLVGLYFLAHGAPLLGLATFLAAKVVGTALVARIFTLTRHSLLEIAWFARTYAALLRFKTYVYERLHQHPVYRHVARLLAGVRERARRVRRGLFHHLRSRWRAVLRRAARRNRAV